MSADTGEQHPRHHHTNEYTGENYSNAYDAETMPMGTVPMSMPISMMHMFTMPMQKMMPMPMSTMQKTMWIQGTMSMPMSKMQPVSMSTMPNSMTISPQLSCAIMRPVLVYTTLVIGKIKYFKEKKQKFSVWENIMCCHYFNFEDSKLNTEHCMKNTLRCGSNVTFYKHVINQEFDD